MLNPPYRAAVIGRTGRGDYGHGLDVALLDQPKLQVVAVADEDADGRARAAGRLGVTNAYADYRAMLEAERPPFVVVAPRWIDGHADMILAAIEHGALAIFCEKPMAPDLAACDAIVDACARAHVKLAMAFQTRYSPRFDRVRELIADGAIGKIVELRGRGKEDHRGGGEDLMVLGSHIMDLARGLIGPAAWCSARVSFEGRPIRAEDVRDGPEGLGPIAGDRIDALFGFDHSDAIYHFASTSRGVAGGRRFGLFIGGTEGAIWMGTGWRPPAHLLRDPSWMSLSDPAGWTEITSAGIGQPETLPDDSLVSGNRAIVADLIRAFETDSQPRVGVEDGRASIEMILACHASHVRGGPVDLPLVERKRHPLLELGTVSR